MKNNDCHGKANRKIGDRAHHVYLVPHYYSIRFGPVPYSKQCIIPRQESRGRASGQTNQWTSIDHCAPTRLVSAIQFCHGGALARYWQPSSMYHSLLQQVHGIVRAPLSCVAP